MGRPRRRHVLGLALGLLIVAALLAYVGPAAVVHALGQARPAFLLLGLAAYGLFFVGRGLRWRLVLGPSVPNVDLRTTTNLTAMGWLVSTFVPMKAGDVTRSAHLALRTRRNVATILGSVVVERAFDVAGLALAASLGLLAMGLVADHHLPSTVAQAVTIAWILPLLGLALLLVASRPIARRRASNVLVRYAALFLEAAHELRKRPRHWAPIAAYTGLTTALQVAVFTFLVLAFLPAAPPVLVAATVPLFLLTFVVSLTPANLGTYEGAFVAVFALVGFATTALIPVAVAVHVLTITFVTLLGGLAFVLDRFEHPAPASQPAPTPTLEAKA